MATLNQIMKPFTALMLITKSRKVKLSERDDDGCWVYLKPGFEFDGTHTIHADTWLECFDCLSMVKKCPCNECKADKATGATGATQ
jgi:hypothetical protein